jgi:hypothetical protein
MNHIKLECECGQRFAFEVEPVYGRMPAPVNCPACGADSTEAANAALAQSEAPQPAAAPAGAGRGPLRVALPPREAPSAAPPTSAATSASEAPSAPAALATSARTGPRRPPGPLPGQIGRSQAKVEAKAKIMWGDPPIQVLAYLRSQGYGNEESSAVLEELVRERTATIRGKGIMNIIGGSILVCLPIGGYFVLMTGEYIYYRAFGLVVVLGFYGIWLVIKGATMVMAPKSAGGDVED